MDSLVWRLPTKPAQVSEQAPVTTELLTDADNNYIGLDSSTLLLMIDIDDF